MVSSEKDGLKPGLNRDSNPGPLAPKARIIPLDHWALRKGTIRIKFPIQCYKEKGNKEKVENVYVAEGGFDPPTSGLWAQHASSAPLC